MSAHVMKRKVQKASPSVKIVEEIDASDLMGLVTGQVSMLVKRGFMSEDDCCELVAMMYGGALFTKYKDAPEIEKAFGTPYFETSDDPEAAEAYFENAPVDLASMREAFAPLLHPIDKLRLVLDEGWSGGAMLLKDKSRRTAFAGVCRAFGVGASALPHTDHVKLDDTSELFEGRPNGQLAANIHLQTAVGGEVVVYDFPTTPGQAKELLLPDSYGVDMRMLPEDTPRTVYHAQRGDLVLFDATRVHAVRPVRKGRRITASCFLWLDSLYRPLRLFS